MNPKILIVILSLAFLASNAQENELLPTQYYTNYYHSGQARLSSDLVLVNKTNMPNPKPIRMGNGSDATVVVTVVVDYKPHVDPIRGKTTPTRVEYYFLVQDKKTGKFEYIRRDKWLDDGEKSTLLQRGSLKCELDNFVENDKKMVGYYLRVLETVELKPELAAKYGDVKKPKPLAVLGPKYVGPKPAGIPQNWFDELEFDRELKPQALNPSVKQRRIMK